MHLLVPIISYYAKPLYYDQYLGTYQHVAVYFTILSIMRSVVYYGQYEILPCPSAVVCSVVLWCFARVLVVAGWGCGPMTHHDLQKKKKKNASAKIHGERVECPRKFWKSACPPTKKVRKKQVGVIIPAADDVPGVFPNHVVPVGIPQDVLSCAWYNMLQQMWDVLSCHIAIKTCLPLRNGLRRLLGHVLGCQAYGNSTHKKKDRIKPTMTKSKPRKKEEKNIYRIAVTCTAVVAPLDIWRLENLLWREFHFFFLRS